MYSQYQKNIVSNSLNKKSVQKGIFTKPNRRIEKYLRIVTASKYTYKDINN